MDDVNSSRKWSFMDDGFFATAFSQDTPLARNAIQNFVRAALDRPDIVIEKIQTQKEERFLDGHGIRMDLLAADPEGRRINIEIQRSSRDLSDRRISYYSAWNTMLSLEKGKSYDDLRERFLIFVCDFDFTGEGRPMYELEVRAGNRKLDTGERILLLTGPILAHEPTSLGRIVQDLYEYNPDHIADPYFRQLMDQTLGNPERMERIMTYTEELIQKREQMARQQAREEGRQLGREEGRQEGIQQGRAEGRQEGIQQGRAEGMELGKLSVVSSMIKEGFSIEKIATLLDLEPANIQRYVEEKKLAVQ